MSYVIAMLVGFVAGIFLCFGTDDWRIQRFTTRGYDTAVKHILEYGYYYNRDGDRINIVVQIGGESNEQ